MHAWYFSLLVTTICLPYSKSLVCYNCSSTHQDFEQCSGAFVKPTQHFNMSRLYLVNCSDNSMCFVRAWSARARHAWIVQRGCYNLAPQDPFLQEMLTPTRAMTCKEERLPDAEYKVCLCAADWCNSAAFIFNKNLLYTRLWFGIYISLSISYLLRLYLNMETVL